ncbi:MAG: hypothetical protein IPM79_28795 [Polyangiaceae bacterium]|nr:hypothetical protein [Polyangiaceae bacterium]MBK8941497.1 hypothetical protein [Polyangiaceae bacterium]
MRLPIVIRSLGVILISPLLTVPTSVVVGGSPEALASSPEAPGPMPSEAVYSDAITNVAKRAAPDSDAALQSAALRPAAVAPAAVAPASVEVSVQCGQEGCVVVSGLEVTIVESVH